MLHQWCSTLDAGGSARVLFVDFAKAFDSVSEPNRRLTDF